MYITWLYADFRNEWNTSYYRAVIPSILMERVGHKCYTAHINEILTHNVLPETQSAIDQSDVIVMERLLTKEAFDFITDMRIAGKKVFATFDDHYGLMPMGGSHTTWRGGKEALNGRGSILNEFRAGLALCDGLMTPSKLLCEDFAPYGMPYYVPNFLLDKLWENLPAKDPDNFVIGWGGSSAHSISFADSGIAPALGQICKKYPKVYVHLQTYDPRITGLFDKFGVRYRSRNWVQFDIWPKIVATFHLGLAPLAGEYDKRRSNLKTLEYGMVGVPWIATDDAPYQESAGGILVKNKTKEWVRAIESLINDASLYDKLSEEGRVWASAFNRQCVSVYQKVFEL